MDMMSHRRAYYWTPASEDKPSIWQQLLWAIDGMIPRHKELDGYSRIIPASGVGCSWWVTLPPGYKKRPLT